MAYRNIVRGCFVAAISAAILLFARDGTDSFAANAAQTILRPITPAQPAPNTNAGTQMSTTPNIPPASSIPGTDAYEIVQLRMRVDALSEAVNALRLQLGQTTRETNATLLTLRRPVCIADQVLRDPVSTATENCSPYMCNRVEGACRASCRNTQDCDYGFVCDTGIGNGVCIRP